MSDAASQPSVPADRQKERPAKRSLRAAIARRLRLLLIAVWIVAGLSFAGRLNWLFDNLTAFVLQFAALAVLFALQFALLKARRWALFSIVLAIAHGVRLWQPSYEATAAGPTFEIVTANVKTSNREFDRFLRFVRRESPDVLVVIEIDDGWAAALESLSDEYPHHVIEPRIDNFGIALLSRVPLSDTRIEYFGDAGVPTIVARLALEGGEPVTVVATHPFPPVRSAVAADRNQQLAAIADFTASATGEVIVMGDLNVAPWSPYFQSLLRDGKLHDSRRGFDLQPTWPAFCPPLMTPIDHVLTSGGLAVIERRTGTPVGSDHLPVVARICRHPAD